MRAVELLGAVSLATDLGTGQPHLHGVRSAVLAAGLARRLGLDAAAVADVQRVALLRFLGCTADSGETARMAGGDDIGFLAAMAPAAMGSRAEAGRALVTAIGAGEGRSRRAALVAGALLDPGGARRSLSAHCEVAAMLAQRLPVGPAVREGVAHGYERWDGRGFPEGLAGEAIPLSVRVAVVARDAELWCRAGSDELARVLRERRGSGYDPNVVDVCLSAGPELLAGLDAADPWEAMLDIDTGGETLTEIDLDSALTVLADFADLKSRWLHGHSRRVADLAAAAAAAAGLPPGQVARLRQAALVHDLGRVGVPNGIWDRPGPLGVGDWQRVRLHPYLTESVLGCCEALAGLGRLAGAHHERLDGSGYPRGSRELGFAEQLLAVADAVAALAADRPHRPAAAPSAVADVIRAEVATGRLGAVAADAVLAAAGQPATASRGRSEWPAGLSEREVEVLRLLARGRSNREVAASLHVSVKTVGRHVENTYAKIGAHSRAAAAVFAMQHRLLDP